MLDIFFVTIVMTSVTTPDTAKAYNFKIEIMKRFYKLK